MLKQRLKGLPSIEESVHRVTDAVGRWKGAMVPLTPVFDCAVGLSEVVPGQVRQRVALPPEDFFVVDAPLQEVVRCPVTAVELAGHTRHGGREPVRGQLRRNSCRFREMRGVDGRWKDGDGTSRFEVAHKFSAVAGVFAVVSGSEFRTMPQ